MRELRSSSRIRIFTSGTPLTHRHSVSLLTEDRIGGNNHHVIAYRYANDRLVNIVLTHPAEGEPESWEGRDHVTQLRKDFEGWDPRLTTLLGMVETAVKWPLRDIAVPDKWSSANQRLILVGDASHAMLSFMASGRLRP